MKLMIRLLPSAVTSRTEVSTQGGPIVCSGWPGTRKASRTRWSKSSVSPSRTSSNRAANAQAASARPMMARRVRRSKSTPKPARRSRLPARALSDAGVDLVQRQLEAERGHGDGPLPDGRGHEPTLCVPQMRFHAAGVLPHQHDSLGAREALVEVELHRAVLPRGRGRQNLDEKARLVEIALPELGTADKDVGEAVLVMLIAKRDTATDVRTAGRLKPSEEHPGQVRRQRDMAHLGRIHRHRPALDQLVARVRAVVEGQELGDGHAPIRRRAPGPRHRSLRAQAGSSSRSSDASSSGGIRSDVSPAGTTWKTGLPSAIVT